MKRIRISGSKSISNRALVLASLSSGSVVLSNVLDCDDTRFLKEALSNFGVTFENLGRGEMRVTPPEKLQGNDSDNFIGNGGTPSRFLAAMSLVLEGTYSLRGVDRMHERPFNDLFEVLKDLGVEVNFRGEQGFLPASFSSSSNSQNLTTASLSGSISSQFLSGLLLVGAKLPKGLEVHLTDEVKSRPYVEMTVEMLHVFGGKVSVSDDFQKFSVQPGLSAPEKFDVPGDSSSASYPIAYSLLSKQPINIDNFGVKTLQGDEKFLDIAEKFGAQVIRKGERVEVYPPQVLSALGEVDFSQMPDVSMTAMGVAAFADGVSEFTGLESLRVKECDRIVAMEEGLKSLGVRVDVEGDTVQIHGASQLKIDQQSKISLHSYNDHRIAMIFGVIGKALGLELEISNSECVGKSWPGFWFELGNWAGELRQVSAAIVQKDSGEYLIVKKPRKDYAWQFPQGGVDAGESLLDAAKRELQEECGSDLGVLFDEKSVGEYAYFFPADFKRHEEHIKGAKVHFFLAKYAHGEVQIAPEELDDFAWVEKEKLSEYFEEEYWEVIQNFL